MAQTGTSSSACRCSARSSYFCTCCRLRTSPCSRWGALLSLACSIARCCSSMSCAAAAAPGAASRTSNGSSAEKLPSTTTTGARSGAGEAASAARSTSPRRANSWCLAVGSMRTSRAVTGPAKTTRSGSWRNVSHPSNSQPESTGVHGPSFASAQDTLNFVIQCGQSARGATTTPATDRGSPRSIWYHGEESPFFATQPFVEPRLPTL
mmetsp:Transcript_3767/g.10999  ORF Transcript_3767/g.10999 Transcript_3767/m.10999 type:complete len:208 (+) Transcript_3767:649-1272(+)